MNIKIWPVIWLTSLASCTACGNTAEETTLAADQTTAATQHREYRGVPPRPFANVPTPSSGTVEVGAKECIGTPEEPAFIIGDGQETTVPEGKWRFTARNCIVANVNLRGKIQGRNLQNVEFRNVEIHHAKRVNLQVHGENIAIVDSHLHHAQGNNGLGAQVACGSSRIWIGNNLLEYNDEDGFLTGHKCKKNPADEIYFYGNTCVNNRENCIDLKWVKRTVISGNDMRGHRIARKGEPYDYDDGSTGSVVNSGSDGSAVLIGSDGTPEATFLFDNVYRDNIGCVRVEDAADVFALNDDCADALPAARWGGYKFDKSGHTRLVDSKFSNVPFMITDNFRKGPVVDTGGNTAVSTGKRLGKNATVKFNTVTKADIESAFQESFGRSLD